MSKKKVEGDIEQLRDFYYNTLEGGKLDKVWYKVQKEFPGEYTRAQVKRFLDDQASVQQTKQFRRTPGMFTSIRGKEPGNIYQIDLMFFGNIVGPQRWSGVLNVIDIYSRHAWSELIKQDPKPTNHKRGTPWRMAKSGGKGQQSVLAAFRKIIERSKVPKQVQMDQGNEFTNTAFQNYLAESNIKPLYSKPQTFMKNAIVERFNRTLRDNFRDKLAQGKTMSEAVQGLQQMVTSYNTDLHSTIKAEPLEVWEGERKNKQEYKNPTFDFKEQEQVRILERQQDYAKSGKYKWSEEIYTIYDVQRSSPTGTSKVARYFIADEDGKRLTYVDSADKETYPAYFMGYQLQRAGKAQRSATYDAKKVAREKKSQAQKQATAKQGRKLAKEGLDDSRDTTKRTQPKRQAQTDPLKLKGKRIKVKWYDEGPLTAEAQRQRGKQGKFFAGKVLSWNGKRKVYRVEYDDDVDGVYETNFIEKASASYIPRENWRLA